MLERLLIPDIRELIAERDFATLGEVLNQWLPADLAALLANLPDDEQMQMFVLLEPAPRAKAFAHFSLEVQRRLLDALPQPDAAELLNRLAPDDRTALFEELPKPLAARLLELLSPEERRVTEELLHYSRDSIGRLMTPDYVAIGKDWSIQQMLDHVRTHGRDSETLNVVYVVGEDGTLVDDLRIREVLLAPLDNHVADLVDGIVVALRASDQRREAVDVFRKYDRTALPVIDAHGILVGIVTIDDVIDVAEQLATRELQRFGGVEALDEPYVRTPLLGMVRKRASWLVFLFLGELLTATAMGYFEREIQKAVVLALFVPLIISSGGNSGSPAATLLIRALALGELKLSDWPWVLRREMASGLLLGLVLGSIGFLRISLWSLFTDLYGEHWLLIAWTVSLALVGVVLWGALSGAILPFALKRLGFDPATSSAPFVATLVDVTGLVIYFSVALVVLRGTLL
ncbi:MAG TPA: magnesium transporter [Pirellulales bacterium]|jgi:magnesium transporter|nr:magnesium transporter [Pirellulales bacterium]